MPNALSATLQRSIEKNKPDRIYDKKSIIDYIMIRSKQLNLQIPEDYEDQIEQALTELINEGAIESVGEGADASYKLTKEEIPVIELDIRDIVDEVSSKPETMTEEEFAEAIAAKVKEAADKE